MELDDQPRTGEGPPTAAAPTADAADAVTPRPSGVPVWVLGAAAVVFLVAAVAFALLWGQERSRAEDLEAEVARYEGRDEARQAEEDALPDLKAIADDLSAQDFDVEYDGDESSLVVETKYNLDWVEAFLDATGFPPATVSRIEETRALDGTQEASGDNVEATWTYHPDDGLSVVFSVDE